MNSIIHKIRGDTKSPSRAPYLQVLNGLVGGTLGIGVLALLMDSQGFPLLMAPFGATCVLMFAAPDTPLAQPRNVIGGHLVSSLIGLVFLKFIGTGPLEMGVAVGLAIALMQLTRTVHPPAGADPLVVLVGGKVGWSFLVAPVLAGSLLLVLIALLINNVGRNKRWPRYWT
jgi:CBS-domain-containing membrane protein